MAPRSAKNSVGRTHGAQKSECSQGDRCSFRVSEEAERHLQCLRPAWTEMHRFGPLIFRNPAIVAAAKLSLVRLTSEAHSAAGRTGVSAEALQPRSGACALAHVLRFPPGGLAVDPVAALETNFFDIGGMVLLALPDFLGSPKLTARPRLPPDRLCETLQPPATTWAHLARQVAMLLEQAAWGLLDAVDKSSCEPSGERDTQEQADTLREGDLEVHPKSTAAQESRRRRRRAAAERRKAQKHLQDSDEQVAHAAADASAVAACQLATSEAETREDLGASDVEEEAAAPRRPDLTAGVSLLTSDELQERRRENLRWRLWALGEKNAMKAMAAMGNAASSGSVAVPETGKGLLNWMQPGAELDTLWMRETRWEARCVRAALRIAELETDCMWDAIKGADEEAGGGPMAPTFFKERWRADMVWRRLQQSRSRPVFGAHDWSWPWVARTPSPPSSPREGWPHWRDHVQGSLCNSIARHPAFCSQLSSTTAAPQSHAETMEPHVLLAVPVSRLHAVASALAETT